MSDVDNKVVVLVIGSLGEVVRKLIELDYKIVEDHRAIGAYAEGLSLKKLLDEWPVLDDTQVFMLHGAMRLSIAKYKHAEKELGELLAVRDTLAAQNFELTHVTLYQLISELFKRRDEIRSQMTELNKLSGGVGKASAIPPDADLVIAKIGE